MMGRERKWVGVCNFLCPYYKGYPRVTVPGFVGRRIAERIVCNFPRLIGPFVRVDS